MDKYQEIREAVERVSKEVIGKTTNKASGLCAAADLAYRWVSVDGNGCIITADCRMDRIGFIINNDIVTGTSNG